MAQAILYMEDVHKAFGAVKAVDGVSLELFPGEVLALVGENSAGKTTLMNILYGILPPDRASISINGQNVAASKWSPAAAMHAGIGMIHQHFTVVPALTVLENVVLGVLEGREFFPRWKRHHRRVQNLAYQYGLEVNLGDRVADLAMGQRQRVEILKALYQNAQIMILDEPTSVLTPQESDALFRFLRSFVAKGNSVIFVTHKMREVMAVSDRVMVLRAGKKIATLQTADTHPDEVVRSMVGGEVISASGSTGRHVSGSVVLSIKGLRVDDERGVTMVDDVDIQVGHGEILGIAGVSGNGQRELAEALLGVRTAKNGRIILGDRDITNISVRERIDLGLGYIPEDRLGSGSIGDLSVEYNLVLDRFSRPPFSHYGFLQKQRIRNAAQRLRNEFDIRVPTVASLTRYLSGGNLQKTIVARTLSSDPRVIVACQPTRGLDVAATAYVRNKLQEAAAQGTGVILISADLDEIELMCDRVAVMYAGRIAGILSRQELNRETLGRLMVGQTLENGSLATGNPQPENLAKEAKEVPDAPRNL